MDSQPQQEYDISTAEILFSQNEMFDIKALTDSKEPWWNRTLCEVSGSWVRIAVMEGDFHWHKHDDTDEFFMVIEGELHIELPDKIVKLLPRQALTVSRGVMHFPRAIGRTVVLLVENAGLNPTGDG